MLSLIYCYLHTYILGGQELGLSKKSLVVTECEGCKVYTTLASTYIYDAQDVQMCYFFVWYKKEKRYIHHRDCKQSPFCSKICGEEHKTSEQSCMWAWYAKPWTPSSACRSYVTPTRSLVLHHWSQILKQERLLADCLQSFHHRALASRKQNEFMANGQL